MTEDHSRIGGRVYVQLGGGTESVILIRSSPARFTAADTFSLIHRGQYVFLGRNQNLLEVGHSIRTIGKARLIQMLV